MRLGIIGAMDVEVALLLDRLEGGKVTRLSRMDFHEGTLEGLPVVVVKSGVGKVDAAVCAEVLALRFAVTHVVNTGVAGCLAPDLGVGDVVVSRDAVHHDVDATNFGYAPGEVPGLGTVAFEADRVLAGVAMEAARAAAPDVSCRLGRVASGDQFVRDQATKERIRTTFQADCCEMEGASIAQACWLAGVPFAIVRAISDKADGSSPVEYPAFERKAAHDCAGIVLEMARRLA